jgi:hypothetical protein
MNTEDNKEEFHYFNDEWNQMDPKYIKKYTPYDLKKFKEDLEKVKEDFNKKEIIKNDKPDGRRYKK